MQENIVIDLEIEKMSDDFLKYKSRLEKVINAPKILSFSILFKNNFEFFNNGEDFLTRLNKIVLENKNAKIYSFSCIYFLNCSLEKHYNLEKEIEFIDLEYLIRKRSSKNVSFNDLVSLNFEKNSKKYLTNLQNLKGKELLKFRINLYRELISLYEENLILF